MAEPNITFTVFGTAKKAEEAIVRLEKKYDDLQNKIKQTAKRSREGTDSALSGFGRLSGQLMSAAGGYTSLAAGAAAYFALQQQILQKADEIALAEDKRTRAFMVQSGLRGLESEAANKRIREIAIGNAAPLDTAFATATQLVSSGFSTADATGEALDVMLKAMAAANARGRNPEEIPQALSMLLAASNLPKTAENLKMAAVGFQRMYRDTDLQIADSKNYAQRSAPYAEKVGFKTGLAAFDLIRQVMPADVASTGLSSGISSMMTMREDRQKTAKLRRMGLRPESIDLVGETLPEALDALGKGLERLPEKMRAGAMKEMFGMEGAPAMSVLINNRGKLPGLMEAATGPGAEKAFYEDAAVGSSGRNAGRIAMAAREEIGLLDTSAVRNDFEGLLNAAKLDAADVNGGVNPYRDTINTWGARLMNAITFGMAPEFSVNSAWGGRGIDARKRLTEESDAAAREERMVKALESIDSKTAPPSPLPLKRNPE
jgi:hypothetical protein